MTTPELLTQLRKLNITLSADNGQLVFNGPKGALTAPLRAALSERKAEILKFLKNAANGVTPKQSSLPRVSREKNVLLSFAQQRLWFLDQLEPGSALYNVPGALRIGGSLSVEVLERCFNEIVRRHEALRTTFSIVEEEPVQVIAASTNVSLPVIDISHFSETKREEEARRLAWEEANKPFDLRQGPLFRTALIRLGENDHVLLLTLHHIVSDGWSMGVLYRELSALYQAFENREPSPLPDLPIQYADFAAWQREWLQGEVLQSQLSYWKKQLDGAPTVLNFPTDRPRPARQSYRGAKQSIELSSELTQGLKALSRKEGVTLYMTLLAVFQVLLHRYSGQDDVVVGSPIAGRNRVETEGLVGFFVNTLVLRSQFSGDLTFRQMLRKVRTTALDAYEHQDLPFEKLVEELRPERDLSRSPLFQVTFTFQNAPTGHPSCANLAVTPVKIPGETAKFDLSLSMQEQGEHLSGTLQYNTDLFERSTMERLIGHFVTLLRGVVADPDQSIARVPLLTEAEKHQCLFEWNSTGREYAKHLCIHQWFEAQAEKAPDALAVTCENRQISYRELDRRANQLARYLRGMGVGPEVLVGVCLERSVEMVIGLLAVLKAGGAYVPLDPSYPKDRIASILADTEAPVLLTQQQLLKRLPPERASVVCIDSDWDVISQESQESPQSPTSPENLAYVIYTSGSSGEPKGVQVEHGGLLNLASWHREAYGISAGDRATQLASPAFDASVWELWPYLMSGASIHLPDEETRAFPARLIEWLIAEDITICFLPTPLAEAVLEMSWPRRSRLRAVLTGGDKLQRGPRKDLSFSLINHYGPTESTVVASSYRVPACCDTAPPIGQPIANTQIYLLDAYLNAVPVGVTGELHIGGMGLARGYLNRPDLTAERFIPNPFSSEPGARLYKTGDLARYLPDGNIEFIGRADHQIKLRGFRIELGEIEAVLARHPAVREALVVAREEVSEAASSALGSDKRLVAYIVSDNGASPPVSELREFARKTLPDYMMPSAFVFLEQLPLTANGKIDRKALPAPPRQDGRESFRDPRTPTEIALSLIWSEILDLPSVGLDDNFFDLGGHSLLAARSMARIKDDLGTELPVRMLFECPTIAQLVPKIHSKKVEGIFHQRQQGKYAHLFELQAGAKDKAIFCFPFRGGLDGEFFNFTRVARHFDSEFSFYGVLTRGVDGVSEPRRSVAEMAADYLAEIRAVQPHGPYIFIGECQGGFVAYEAARQMIAAGAEMGLLVLLDTHSGVPAKGFWQRCAVPVQHRVGKSPAWKYFKRRYNHHIQVLRQQSAARALSYSMEKLTRAVSSVPFLIDLEQAERPTRAASEQDCAKLWLDRARDAFNLAIRRYDLPCYTGRVSLLLNERAYAANRMRDWADYIPKGLEVYKLPGGHDVCVPQNIPTVASILKACLAGVDTKV